MSLVLFLSGPTALAAGTSLPALAPSTVTAIVPVAGARRSSAAPR